mmetsp:Transcript_2406/g.3448  ORF Transcript_2406/g.3448 Transcript_2406/m.3448 type:complete len:246 (+) Transcript_2406:311-1048(+)
MDQIALFEILRIESIRLREESGFLPSHRSMMTYSVHAKFARKLNLCWILFLTKINYKEQGKLHFVCRVLTLLPSHRNSTVMALQIMVQRRLKRRAREMTRVTLMIHGVRKKKKERRTLLMKIPLRKRSLRKTLLTRTLLRASLRLQMTLMMIHLQLLLQNQRSKYHLIHSKTHRFRSRNQNAKGKRGKGGERKLQLQQLQRLLLMLLMTPLLLMMHLPLIMLRSQNQNQNQAVLMVLVLRTYLRL